MTTLHRLAVIVCCAALTTGAPAQEQPADLNIPPQSLAAALDALTQQTGLQPFYTDASVQGLKSSGIVGRYDLREAVEKLLAGTGLSYRFTGPKTVAIKKPEQVAANEVTEPSTGKEQPKESSEPQEVTLPEMTVTAKPTDATSYSVPNATTATKTDTPIMETPVSIQVIPQQVLRDQQAIRLSDALKNVSGVQPSFAFTNREGFTLRGFDNSAHGGGAQYRDGFRVQESILSLANAERVEVLKSPASVLFGRIEPGGLINIATKRPLASPYYALEQQFGSFDTYRTTLDATGPITQDGTLAYRLNFEYLDQDSFRDFVAIDRTFVAPSLTWQPSGRTQIDLDFIYQDEDSDIDDGIPAIGDRPAPIPIERSLSEEEVSDTNSKNYDTALRSPTNSTKTGSCAGDSKPSSTTGSMLR